MVSDYPDSLPSYKERKPEKVYKLSDSQQLELERILSRGSPPSIAPHYESRIPKIKNREAQPILIS